MTFQSEKLFQINFFPKFSEVLTIFSIAGKLWLYFSQLGHYASLFVWIDGYANIRILSLVMQHVKRGDFVSDFFSQYLKTGTKIEKTIYVM